MPQISVIIPTYNHAAYVLDAIGSVFAQSFADLEVIVINDGSTDGTAQVLRPLAESGKIQYLEQTNRGQAAARNRGIEEARGEFIAMLDDDDLWPPDKLQWQVDWMRANAGYGLIGGGVEIMDSGGNMVETAFPREGDLSFESLFDGSPFWSPGQTLIDAAILRKLGGFDERIWGADDLDLWLRLSRQTRLHGVRRIALRYRRHAGNASRHTSRMLRNNLRVYENHLRDVPPGARGRLAKIAYRAVYRYVGYASIKVLKEAVRGHRGTRSRVLSSLSDLTLFAIPAARDRLLFTQLFADLLPGRLRLAVRALGGLEAR